MPAKRLVLHVLGMLVLAWVVMACARQPPGGTPVLVPAATPTLTPTATLTATPAPSVQGIYTPEDIQWQYDQWPNEFKFAVDPEGEVVVLFAYPDPLTDWAGRVFIHHIPSFSSVTLGYGGEIAHEHYGSEEGRARLQAVLDDAALMARIRQRVDAIWGQAQPGYADLLATLREKGATVEAGGTVPDSFFPIEGQVAVVNGAEVGAFVYPGPATAAYDARRISPDGNRVELAEDRVLHGFWVATPHF
jgi:hypothetical protein